MTWAHFRQSINALRREPGFTAFAILTLALGIGASTAMFSVFHGVLLAPVPYADPHRVVAINTRWTDTGAQTIRVSGGDYIDLLGAHDIFDATAHYNGGEIGVQLRDRAEWAGSYWVSPDFFRVFEVAPLRDGCSQPPKRSGRLWSALLLHDGYSAVSTRPSARLYTSTRIRMRLLA